MLAVVCVWLCCVMWGCGAWTSTGEQCCVLVFVDPRHALCVMYSSLLSLEAFLIVLVFCVGLWCLTINGEQCCMIETCLNRDVFCGFGLCSGMYVLCGASVA
jgi:hypothetical protein